MDWKKIDIADLFYAMINITNSSGCFNNANCKKMASYDESYFDMIKSSQRVEFYPLR